MAFLTFDELCRELCKQAGDEAAILTQDESGNSALSLHVAGVNITIVPAPSQAADSVLVLTELGEIPADRELPVMLALLDINYLARGVTPTSICRGPKSGDAVVQSTFRLSEVNTDSFFKTLIRLAAFVHEWQGGHALDDAGQAAAELAESFI